MARFTEAARRRLLWLVLLGVGLGCARTEVQDEQAARSCRVDDPNCVVEVAFPIELNLGDAGYGTSVLVEDELGTAGWVSFQSRLDDGTTELKLLHWQGTEVEVQTLATGVGPFTAIGRHPLAGWLVVVYYDQDSGNLRLAWNQGGSWRHAILDEDGDAGAFLDMAVDAAGGVHVAYIERLNKDLRYLLWQDGTILVGPELVDSGIEPGQVVPGGDVDLKVGLDLMPTGEPVVTYYDASNGQLRTARYSSVTQDWEIEVLGVFHEQERIFPDSDGVATLAGGRRLVPRKQQLTLYENLTPLDDSAYDLLSDTQIKILQVVPTAEYALDYVSPYGADYGRWSSIRVRADGSQLVTFYDAQRGDLVAALNDSPGSNPAWRFEVIDSFGATGDFNDLALVPLVTADGIQRGDIPVVTYFDQSNANLMLAYRHHGRWQRVILDASGITGLAPAIAATPAGWVVIAYHTFDFRTGTATLRVLRTLPVRP